MDEPVWFEKYQLRDIQPLCEHNMMARLGIELTVAVVTVGHGGGKLKAFDG